MSISYKGIFKELKEDKSLIFYYANYDNSISCDEQKYLIVSCALLKDRGQKNILIFHKMNWITGAIVDRLAYKAHILYVSGESSHRFEETISWLKNNN